MGEDPYLGTRMLMGFDGSMIGAAQMKAASVSLEEWGFLSSGKSMGVALTGLVSLLIQQPAVQL